MCSRGIPRESLIVAIVVGSPCELANHPEKSPTTLCRLVYEDSWEIGKLFMSQTRFSLS